MYEVLAQYPQISGGNNPNFEKFNQTARASAAQKVAAFKKDVAPAENEEEPRPEGSMGSDLNVSYKVALAQDDLVSIDFNVGTYFQGAAHPNMFSDPLNYDLKNGKELKLSDLFKPGAKFLQVIAAYCVADLKKQAKDKSLLDDDIDKGAAARYRQGRRCFCEELPGLDHHATRAWVQFRRLPGWTIRRRPAARARALLSVEGSHQP
jgi:hypothetical protein